MPATETHCPYCALQCGIALTPQMRRVRLEPTDFPANRGGLCAKGWTAAELLDHPDRLLTPLVRRTPATAPARCARRPGTRRSTRIADGDQAQPAAVRPGQRRRFGGGGLTNEKAYTLGKFARVALRSASIDYNGRFCMSSAATAGQPRVRHRPRAAVPARRHRRGEDRPAGRRNPADTMPPSMQYFDAGRARGAQHIVVDPRRTATAAGAHLHLQPLPGTDLALANGLLHIAIREGYVDEDYIAATAPPASTRSAPAVAAYWPDRVERMTGVPVADLRETVRLLATARPGDDPHRPRRRAAQQRHRHRAGLHQPGARPRAWPGGRTPGYGTITGQGNGQGGREHGQKADQLPGYRRLDDPAARAHVAAVWGIDPDELPRPGLSAYEMLDRLGTDGGVRALLVLASNIVVSAPHAEPGPRPAARAGLPRRLRHLPLRDRRARRRRAAHRAVGRGGGHDDQPGGPGAAPQAALPPPPDVRTDLEVLAELAERLGRGQFFSADPRTVFDELRRASAGGIADYAGITYERIDAEQGVFWPCPAEDHPGTPRLFADGFPTPDGRARFVRVEHRDPAEMPDREYPYVLTTGRIMQQYQSGNQTRRVHALTVALPEPRVELHPDLARRLGIADSDLVELRTRRGTAVFRARLNPASARTPSSRRSTGAGQRNALTNPALDRTPRCPRSRCARSPSPRHQEGPLGALHTPLPAGRLRLRGQGPRPAVPSTRPGYTVPAGVVAQAVYFRGGNAADELVCVVLMRDGAPMRYFPIGAKATCTSRCAWSRTSTGTSSSCARRARGVTGTVVVDLGWWRSDAAPRGHRQRHGRRPHGRGDPRPRRRRSRITMFGDEPYGNYNRILLSNVLAGVEDESGIFLNNLSWYAENGITLHAGRRIARIDRHAKLVYAEDGSRHAVRQADHRHRQPPVRAADRGHPPPRPRLPPGRLRVPHARRHPRDDPLRPRPRAGGRDRRRPARPGGGPRPAEARRRT